MQLSVILQGKQAADMQGEVLLNGWLAYRLTD
jgi:hypothetical protein